MTLEAWRYCPVCRHELAHRGLPENPYVKCSQCGFSKYDNPLPTTVAVIRDRGKYLFVRRAIAPQLGKWDAVGGFLAPGERAESCLIREAQEEIGCTPENLVPIGSYASTYGDTGLTTIGFAFTCTLAPGSTIRLSPENSEYGWFPMENIPELAFGDVQRAVMDAVRLNR